jgi:ligand-binding sensor domain-containing protein
MVTQMWVPKTGRWRYELVSPNLETPMKHLLLCITLVSLIAAGATSAWGARHPKVATAEAKITAISKDSITVQSGKASHTYKISSQTTIHVDGRKAEAKDLKKGMHADVTTSQLDVNTASAIEASNPS